VNADHDYGQVNNMAIGDIGSIGPQGDFEFLFNICDQTGLLSAHVIPYVQALSESIRVRSNFEGL